ncbi:MAG: hypothetical protein HZC29_05810 [Thaumarchaeota archaeon]|nr:hypothetical protein [Nitrososphaerota archaeon]
MKIFEISSTDYMEDKRLINNALSDMAGQMGMSNDFEFGQPTSRFGWTFFKLWIKPNLQMQIIEKFDTMIRKSKGANHDEKFTNFMSDYFQSKGSKVKIKMTEV